MELYTQGGNYYSFHGCGPKYLENILCFLVLFNVNEDKRIFFWLKFSGKGIKTKAVLVVKDKLILLMLYTILVKLISIVVLKFPLFLAKTSCFFQNNNNNANNI